MCISYCGRLVQKFFFYHNLLRCYENTEKESLVNARVGQGAFRMEVLQRWNFQCAVTGSATMDAVRASHIKPWRDSTNSERLDPQNGLPLVASLDALFDAGLISFNSDGNMLVSSFLNGRERKIFSLNGQKLSKMPSKATAAYLSYHEANIFRK
jgi:putative restriction endonuclease